MKIFAEVQKIGKALMTPVAILPAAGLLDTFLNAPEYILTYEELLECLWKDGSGDMIRLRVAISRLRIVLSVDPEISIFQKDINKYQLVLPEKG